MNNNEIIKTKVVSAFPGCGKTYAYSNLQDKWTILDSDSSQFSWIKDENGNNTTERNPEFPNNYINHIKENIGKADIIFVSSHKVVRDALRDADIKFHIYYPGKECDKNNWIQRFKNRRDNDKFIKFMSDNFYKFIDEIEEERYSYNKNYFYYHRLYSQDYLDELKLFLLTASES